MVELSQILKLKFISVFRILFVDGDVSDLFLIFDHYEAQRYTNPCLVGGNCHVDDLIPWPNLFFGGDTQRLDFMELVLIIN